MVCRYSIVDIDIQSEGYVPGIDRVAEKIDLNETCRKRKKQVPVRELANVRRAVPAAVPNRLARLIHDNEVSPETVLVDNPEESITRFHQIWLVGKQGQLREIGREWLGQEHERRIGGPIPLIVAHSDGQIVSSAGFEPVQEN